ncbi:WGR domain-containing protein [Novosphingobium sp.]|uniref:WGR domain-containing protein n=1 Tax=Novosphingobium sp. TaxID=1874826 RepID=UPI00344CCBE7
MQTPISQSWHWQAIDTSRNVAREYNLWIQTDLFGWTVVERRWGRIGSRGQSLTESFQNMRQAEAIAKLIRERRASALKRIGVRYHEVG